MDYQELTPTQAAWVAGYMGANGTLERRGKWVYYRVIASQRQGAVRHAAELLDTACYDKSRKGKPAVGFMLCGKRLDNTMTQIWPWLDYERKLEYAHLMAKTRQDLQSSK